MRKYNILELKIIWSSGLDCCVHLYILKKIIKYFFVLCNILGVVNKNVPMIHLEYHNFQNSEEKNIHNV